MSDYTDPSDLNKDGKTDMAEAVVGGEEHIAAQEAHVAEVAAAEAARVAALPPTDLCHGENTYWSNAIAYGSGGGETAHMFPEDWGAEGETRSGTIRKNAEEGLWLPLYIPAGCDGSVGAVDPVTGELLPEVIFYATPQVASMFDQNFGPVHSSPEVDQSRYQEACALGLEAASYPGGSVYVNPPV